MTGSETCADVCRELGISCLCGISATALTPPMRKASALWDQAHSLISYGRNPYWRQKIYTVHPGDLSAMPTLAAFLERYAAFISNCAKVMAPSGKFTILMGDYCDRRASFVPLTYHTKQLAFEAGLRQSCTEIIRFRHGATSSRKVYRSSFIPGLHDVWMVFEKE